MKKTFITADGNEAAAKRAYAFTEVAAIYPITPSSPMAGKTDAWSAKGKKNIFGQTVTVCEMQSEAGAVGAIHGSLQAGALSTTFTSSQGLMLMIPTLYRIVGEKLPAVLHIAARTVGTHAMSIFGDHSDVMTCRDTGLAQFSTGSVQEVADLAAVAHLAAIETNIPFMHFFDGFRTSHEINKIEYVDDEAYTALVDKEALQSFKDRALNPEHPTLRNTVQNDDIYFQIREANNKDYDALPEVVEKYLNKISEFTGREYHLFNYYGAEDATDVIIAMGSVSGAAKEAADSLIKQGKKVGYLQVHLYRPFSAKHFISALPKTVKRIAVLDRCKDMGALGEPLFEDVCTALKGTDGLKIIGGRYGLSSKDTDPGQILAVYENLAKENSVESFTIGINDDVTHRSLEPVVFESDDEDTIECKFWGLGGDGTVGANHNTIEIINDTTAMYGQAYFEYDAKKSFGVTKSNLRFSKHPISSSYYVKHADFTACHSQTYLNKFELVDEIKNGGKLLLNFPGGIKELDAFLCGRVKRMIAQKGLELYVIDATAIADKLKLGSHTNTILQAAFFSVMEIVPKEQAFEEMKQLIRKTYFTKGEEVVAKNISAVDAGAEAVNRLEVPASWLNAPDTDEEEDRPEVIKNLLDPINYQKGYKLPVSSFLGIADGKTPMGLTAYEKRGIATHVPKWDSSKCLQCNRCALVCPHAVIRPYLLTEEEKAAAPAGFETAEAKGAKGFAFSLQISNLDCSGCGSCVECCPAKEKAITMVPAEFTEENRNSWDYALSLPEKKDMFNPYSIKGSQFRTPLVEFSAACAGCGETPYAKLLTQLFGDRIYWANGTGCSQAWGSGMPGIPYTTNKKGFGPAWTNSLFENNAELELGIFLAVKKQREKTKADVAKYYEETASTKAKAWLDGFDDFDSSRELSDALIEELETVNSVSANEILKRKDQLTKKTFWMYGGDGWAYDIGFGGLDHVIATGEDINVFVIDTEVYSNTGGQSSKATPLGAVAQFNSAGKKTRKKDLGAIFSTYGNVYVAQVAMGADPNQLIKAIKEAQEHKGPSLIVAYTPCTAHGIKGGMANAQKEMKRAVDAGYWTLYRYDPDKEEPLTLDSGKPTLPFEEFLDGETRYSALKLTFPDNARELFSQAADEAEKKYESYTKK